MSASAQPTFATFLHVARNAAPCAVRAAESTAACAGAACFKGTAFPHLACAPCCSAHAHAHPPSTAVAAAGLSLVGAAAPVAAQAADGPTVDTAVASVVDIVKATGEVVKQGVSAAQTGAEYAKAAYEQASRACAWQAERPAQPCVPCVPAGGRRCQLADFLPGCLIAPSACPVSFPCWHDLVYAAVHPAWTWCLFRGTRPVCAHLPCHAWPPCRWPRWSSLPWTWRPPWWRRA